MASPSSLIFPYCLCPLFLTSSTPEYDYMYDDYENGTFSVGGSTGTCVYPPHRASFLPALYAIEHGPSG